MTPHVLFAILSCIALGANGQIEPPRTATAFLNAGNIFGSVSFTEVEGGIHVAGAINGLPPGKYGFHVHELGNITTCDATGAHFNPDGNPHGGQDHEVRHVGDLGNVEFVEVEGQISIFMATIDLVDPIISLRGRNSILGRAIVLHAEEDDLGLTSHELSSTTGNAGARVACGVIGILLPVDPWNSARTVGPSAALITIALFFMYFFKS